MKIIKVIRFFQLKIIKGNEIIVVEILLNENYDVV
jgi:hypothetical protein